MLKSATRVKQFSGVKAEIPGDSKILTQAISLLGSEMLLDQKLVKICNIIPKAYQHSKDISVRVFYNSKSFVSKNFSESPMLSRQVFELPGGSNGAIEIYFSGYYTKIFKKQFIETNSEFLKNITTLLVGSIAKYQLSKLVSITNERSKELKGISRAAELLKRSHTLEESLQNICSFLPEAWQYPAYTAARITYGNNIFKSKSFKDSSWVQRVYFKTPGNKHGEIEIFYLKEFPEADEGPFLAEERNLLENLALLISGTASEEALQHLLIENTERLKELKGINQTSAILKQSTNIEDALRKICNILPDAWQFPEYTVARVSYKSQKFTSKNFKVTKWQMKQTFETSDNSKGLIEIYYTREFPEADEGPFLKEERNLLINLSSLISGSATKDVLNKLQYENRERLKELSAINQTSAIIAKGETIEETLNRICHIIPKSWQYPEFTAAKIIYEGHIYISKSFKETVWVQRETFMTFDNKKGTIEIYYLREFPTAFEGPFLKEERQLLINLGKLINGYLNNYKGREILNKSQVKEIGGHNSEEYRKSLISNKQPLQLFFNKQILDKYIYLDMMKYKVKDILFVATLYDAFILENEDSFFEQFMGEIYQYSLFSLPRITGVTSAEEAIELLKTTRFDLVILMVGIDSKAPIELSKSIKKDQPNLPIYLLLNQKSNIKYLEELVPTIRSVDKLFVWNGNSQIIFAIVKSIEDSANVENDTKMGLVRVILVIEDSAQYYSKYLQILYSIVFGQIQQLLPEVEKNEIDKISKMRSRPKILHARNYEDAMYIYNKYKDFLLCVISDVEFERDGKLDKTAGIKFIKYLKSNLINLPIVLQSSDIQNEKIAEKLGVSFLNKNSESLLTQLKQFITYHLGFGDFIFRDKEGRQLAVAKSLKEFRDLLYQVPEESLFLHSEANQFSLWLMSRGEIKLAKTINPIRIKEFNTIEDFRQSFIKTINTYKEEKIRGKILNFDESRVVDEKNIYLLSSGSLGGKGRGLAFINTLIYNLDFSAFSNEINIRTPITAIIGTDEFEHFMERNHLYDKIFNRNVSYEEIKHHFLHAHLSHNIMRKLESFITCINKPIAVRSSSLSEDSLSQPFAGVFDTFVVLNNSKNLKINLEQLTKAIKLVYASIYSDHSRSYFRAIHHKVEEERMAVVLQELVGCQYGHFYYPHISGTAQSYNYYPVANMKPEEGFAVAAVGLGNYVVGGGKSYRFSPKYPKIENFSRKDLLSSTQVGFLAVDLSKKNIDYIEEGEMAPLKMLDLSVAEKDGTLKHCASVYNPDNDRVETGINSAGPRIVNFANILKYNYIPLAQLIDVLLNTIKDAQGCPVEIEYAVDLNHTLNDLPSFYLLQIKPLVGNQLNNEADFEEISKKNTILYTESSLGNGELNDIRDIIFVDVEKFDKMKTLEMAKEIEHLNNIMLKNDRKYILIGPGRWGTQDQFLGIPVVWGQISNAKVIVEISLSNYPLDSSLGSHFFHNVTSMNIGYFSVHDTSPVEFIQWNMLNKQRVMHKTNYFKHIHFNKPLKVVMNGRQKKSAIII
jgi:hypothetical protein